MSVSSVDQELSELRVAVIRGPNLNKFEMQSYEPLTKKYDLTAYTTYNHRFEIDGIDIRIRKLHCFEEFAEGVPFPLSRLCLSLIYRSGYHSYMLGLEKELKDKDIAHVAETHNRYSYQAVRTRERLGRPKVAVTAWENIPFRIGSDFVPEVRKGADVFIAATERAKKTLMLEGIGEGRIHVVPAGVDLDRFRPRRKNRELLQRLELTEDDLIVLFIGRLAWEKGIHDLIYAAKMTSQDPELNGKPIKFLIVGTGVERESILQEAKILQVSENVRLVGNVPYMEIHEYHNIGDMLVLPSILTRSWQEQFGMVLAEAMASGNPVISTSSGSIPEVVGDCGLLVQPGDSVSLYHAIRKLATDEELRMSMGRRARIRAEKRFDSRKTADQIGAIYEALVS